LRINRAATCVQWSPNEKKFAVGCGHRCICVCYFEPNQCFWVAKHIKKQIRSTTLCLDWHPNSCLIAAGGSDFKCRIFGAYVPDIDGPSPAPTKWSAKISSNECVAEFSTANHGWVHSCSFNQSGTILAFVGHDSTVYMVDANKNSKYLISKRTPFLPFLSMKFVTENTIIAAVCLSFKFKNFLNQRKLNFFFFGF
jgi:actin related protein 2/3 complex, subunit 1A/1B